MNCPTKLRSSVLLPLIFLLVTACDEQTRPDSSPDKRVEARDLEQRPPEPKEKSPAVEAKPDGSDKEAEAPDEASAAPPEPHPGPWLWVTRSSAAIYANPQAKRSEKLGYAKQGGQIPILDGKVEGEDCSKGWYKVRSGGFICSSVGTTDAESREVKFRPSQPNIDEILPYKYARNAKNGTPLYKSIPTKEQTYKYEPYLPGAIAQKEALAKEKAADRKQMEEAGLTVGDRVPPPPPALDSQKEEPLDEDGNPKLTKAKLPQAKEGEAKKVEKKVGEKKVGDDEQESTSEPQEAPPAPDVPLWEREEALHEVTLAELQKESDDVLGARMMKGFYVAIDKTFNWDGRTWYKTTKGMVTPSDRFWQTEGSDFKGAEIDGEEITLPLGWVVGVQKNAPTYSIDTETNQRKPVGSKDKFEMVQLQYSYHQIGDIEYFQMADGDWIRDRHIRMTTPGQRPEEVGPNERWIDVDISEQTLVVFEGDRPVYATLISTGKESRDKAKDHSTPRGMWRVREKHIASTMDGDGTAAGDMPYSIEDVPYIMYFHKSYATHGAFWHRNYGAQMSHGCINLAPLDAKWIFFFSEPHLEEGFDGNWSSDERPGSMVVVHD